MAELDNKIEVSIQDSSVGMSRVHLSKIFEQYYRIREHACRFSGLSIGL